jgi:hypothetical protein
VRNPDLCEDLALTDEELQWNKELIETDHTMDFDPNFTPSHREKGFRIFAFEKSLNEILARRLKISGPSPGLMTVFLDAHVQVLRPGEFDQSVNVMVTTETEDDRKSEILSLTLDNPEIPSSFTSVFLGGLLIVLQKTQINVPLLICCCSEFLLRALVKDREKFKNNMLKGMK